MRQTYHFVSADDIAVDDLLQSCKNLVSEVCQKGLPAVDKLGELFYNVEQRLELVLHGGVSIDQNLFRVLGPSDSLSRALKIAAMIETSGHKSEIPSSCAAHLTVQSITC